MTESYKSHPVTELDDYTTMLTTVLVHEVLSFEYNSVTACMAQKSAVSTEYKCHCVGSVVL